MNASVEKGSRVVCGVMRPWRPPAPSDAARLWVQSHWPPSRDTPGWKAHRPARCMAYSRRSEWPDWTNWR